MQFLNVESGQMEEMNVDEAKEAFVETKYPEVSVELVGQDGNAFNVLAIVNRGLKSHGVCKEERDQFMAEAMSGDYDHLLRTCMAWVTVE